MPLTSIGHHEPIAALMELSLTPTVAAPARARAAVTAWLGQESQDAVLTEMALLLVSELVTNCVRHARVTDDEPLRLDASLSTTTLRLELWDNGTDGTVARRPPGRDGDAGGFGLDFVARLSSGWGIDRDAAGTTVWLELPLEPTRTA
jgi:serine/threonine-protein kinase RsbW